MPRKPSSCCSPRTRPEAALANPPSETRSSGRESAHSNESRSKSRLTSPAPVQGHKSQPFTSREFSPTATLSLFVNGQLQPATEAYLRADDHGFRYGDGLFETIRAHAGQPAFWDANWQRLQRGAEFLRLRLPFDSASCRLSAIQLTAIEIEGQAINLSRKRFLCLFRFSLRCKFRIPGLTPLPL